MTSPCSLTILYLTTKFTEFSLIVTTNTAHRNSRILYIIHAQSIIHSRNCEFCIVKLCWNSWFYVYNKRCPNFVSSHRTQLFCSTQDNNELRYTYIFNSTFLVTAKDAFIFTIFKKKICITFNNNILTLWKIFVILQSTQFEWILLAIRGAFSQQYITVTLVLDHYHYDESSTCVRVHNDKR